MHQNESVQVSKSICQLYDKPTWQLNSAAKRITFNSLTMRKIHRNKFSPNFQLFEKTPISASKSLVPKPVQAMMKA